MLEKMARLMLENKKNSNIDTVVYSMTMKKQFFSAVISSVYLSE